MYISVIGEVLKADLNTPRFTDGGLNKRGRNLNTEHEQKHRSQIHVVFVSTPD
jgi:hypothetical protein